MKDSENRVFRFSVEKNAMDGIFRKVRQRLGIAAPIERDAVHGKSTSN
jgi:hypothetical protein